MNKKTKTSQRALPAAAAALAVGLLSRAALAAPEAVFVHESAAKASTATMAAFWIIGGLTVIGALITVTRRNPVAAAVALVCTLATSAGLYLLLHATFMAAIQVMVYAGAIMVLFVFVIMAVKDPEQEEIGISRNMVTKAIGAIAILLLFLRMVSVLMGPEIRSPRAVPAHYGQAASLGKMFFGVRPSCEVQFDYPLDGKTTKVDLVGDFRGWRSPIPMTKHNKTWRARVTLPHDSTLSYGFILDGSNAVHDPAVPERNGARSTKKITCPVQHANFLFPFEAISILLLTAIVGAVVVSRRKRHQDDEGSHK